MNDSYEYYRDFAANLLYRWDGEKIYLWLDEEWVDDSDTWFDLADLNYGYEGSRNEAVRVDAEGNRL